MYSFSRLDNLISSHEAWSNKFFDRVQHGITLDSLRIVCPEYFQFTAAFPGILSNLVSRTEGGVQFHLVSILYSELGSGTESHAHSRLFRILCEELGAPVSTNGGGRPALPSTVKLIEGMRHIYGKNPIIESLGAQYALEFQADNMLRSFRRAFSILERPRAKAPEGMLFFTVHECDEPQHSDAMQKALLRCIENEAQLSNAARGAENCLDLLAGFWGGLYARLFRPTVVSAVRR